MGIETIKNSISKPNANSQTPSNKLGKDDFLKLLVTQLRYQDPTKPMSNEQFIAQTAQFSTLEQMQDVNKNIKSLIELQKSSTRTDALSMIGKQVTAKGSNFSLSGASSIEFGYSVSERGNITINILDTKKNIIRQISLGQHDAGKNSFIWDCRDSKGTRVIDGSYSYEVLAKDDNGNDIGTDTMITGVVDGIAFDKDQLYISIAGTSFPLSSITKIQ